MDKSRLLDKVGAIGDDRLLLAKVLDRAEQAQSRNIPAATDFLSPQQQMVTLDLLRLAGIPETGGARGEQIRSLFAMTPHLFRIGKAGAQRLAETTRLQDTASCILNVYRAI